MRERKRATRIYLIREHKLSLAAIEELTCRQIHELYLSTGREDEQPASFTAPETLSQLETVRKVAKLIGRTPESILEGLKWNGDRN